MEDKERDIEAEASREPKQHDRIELRSEKVRTIIGAKPHWLARYGNTLLVILFIIIALVVAFMPYPYGSGETILEHFML
jgi:hypothetical protein